jgi:hypothetical protein
MPSQFTQEEAALMADQQFFLAKAHIMVKMRHLLGVTHETLKNEVASAALVTPPDFDPANCHFVKGEALESITRTPLPFGHSFGGDTISCVP